MEVSDYACQLINLVTRWQAFFKEENINQLIGFPPVLKSVGSTSFDISCH